jgi:hypothetical protein
MPKVEALAKMMKAHPPRTSPRANAFLDEDPGYFGLSRRDLGGTCFAGWSIYFTCVAEGGFPWPRLGSGVLRLTIAMSFVLVVNRAAGGGLFRLDRSELINVF